MNPRRLKIEAVGDFWRGKVNPRIRLNGQWLERAGFKRGNRVEIRLVQPGILTLQFIESSSRRREADIESAPSRSVAGRSQNPLNSTKRKHPRF
jgi:hypothetical protein